MGSALARLVLLAALCSSLAGSAAAVKSEDACTGAYDVGSRWGVKKEGRYIEFGPVRMCPRGRLSFEWSGGDHGVFQIPSRACPTNYTAMATSDYRELAGATNGGAYTWSVPEEPGTYYVTCQVSDHCNQGMLATVIVTDGGSAASFLLPAALSAALLLLLL